MGGVGRRSGDVRRANVAGTHAGVYETHDSKSCAMSLAAFSENRCFLSFWLFSNQHVWLDMVGPLSTMAFGYLGITVYNYIQEEKNKQFLKDSFKGINRI